LLTAITRSSLRFTLLFVKATVVKSYKSRRQMQRGIERMANRGYEVGQQSGEFSTNPFTFRWNRRKVVVTFLLGQ
jgi:hypothetical protein